MTTARKEEMAGKSKTVMKKQASLRRQPLIWTQRLFQNEDGHGRRTKKQTSTHYPRENQHFDEFTIIKNILWKTTFILTSDGHVTARKEMANLHWQGWAGMTYLNICYLEMPFGNVWGHQVLHKKNVNLHWHAWARIMYLNIFYLKCLWEGLKT